MAVDLHTSGMDESSLPYDSLLAPSTHFTHSNINLFKINDSSHLHHSTNKPHMHMPHKFDSSHITSEDHKWGSSSEGSLIEMFENMKIEESENSRFHHSSYQYQLSRLRQEEIHSFDKKLAAYRENHSRQFQKGKGSGGVGFGTGDSRRCSPPPPQKQGTLEKQKVFRGNIGSRGMSCGTGVFLPRGGVGDTIFESHDRPGCSTVLIPERVVQALQLHFDQIAATSGPKPRAFPPLHDVLVSTNRDGMYSLQKRQTRKKRTTHNVQNEMILPQEWTY